MVYMCLSIVHWYDWESECERRFVDTLLHLDIFVFYSCIKFTYEYVNILLLVLYINASNFFSFFIRSIVYSQLSQSAVGNLLFLNNFKFTKISFFQVFVEQS